MPLMDSTKMIPTYVSDFGITINNYPIKMLQGYADKLSGEYESREGIICGSTTLFRPRALVATFNDGVTVRYPIGRRENLVGAARRLLENGAVCLDYEGEYWPYVPASVFSGSYRSTTLQITQVNGEKSTGTFIYRSDFFGMMPMSYSVETIPGELSAAIIRCLEDPKPGRGFCSAKTTGVTPRRLRGKGLVSGQTRTYARDIKVSALNPSSCAAQLSSWFYCFSYIGERILNLHLLLKTGSGVPALPPGQ